MKLLSLLALPCLSLFLLQSPAQAMILAPGSFIPVQCGAAESASTSLGQAIRRLCIGQVEGSATIPQLPAVNFEFADGSTRIYQVVSTASDLVAFLDGHTSTRYYLKGPDGDVGQMVLTNSGTGALTHAEGQVAGVGFSVTAFENVFVIQ